MDSPQSVVSPFKSAFVENQKSDACIQSSVSSKAMEANGDGATENLIGVLDVHIHQARDIHNICIYQKQDVYAKLCLTSDRYSAVSTQIINGGGRNPVFNQNLRFNVRTHKCSLKCELWMLSRVKNYLGDQLLGFALVPLSEVLAGNGNLEKEFSLSSTDLFHSPAGFVHLSLSYNGACPEVMPIPASPQDMSGFANEHNSSILESLSSDLEHIEFPDPKIANENQMMVSEYIGMPCSNMDSQSSESLANSDAENQLSSEMAVLVPKVDSPPSSVSTTETHDPVFATSESSDTQAASKSLIQEHKSSPKEKTEDAGVSESASSGGDHTEKPLVSVNIDAEQNVVQQDIVDMYMKSMQQFTESLAKMNLPLDTDNGSPNSGSSSSHQKLTSPKNNGSRVFYGSRAFF